MEAPERKKLKSTYRAPANADPLPAGWSEHSAPTGHKYYYNATTKQSTYTRPVATPLQDAAAQHHSPSPAPLVASTYNNLGNAYAIQSHWTEPSINTTTNQPAHSHYHQHQQHSNFRARPEDRPKRKSAIPNCAPWILVYTKLGRRFVHNPTTRESFWKFPADVMAAVIQFDRLDLDKKLGTGREKRAVHGHGERTEDGLGTGSNRVAVDGERARRRRSESLQREDEEAMAAELAVMDQAAVVEAATAPAQAAARPRPADTEDAAASDSDSYEEVEVTDSEDEIDNTQDPASAHARPEVSSPSNQPVEFDEADIAYQLAAMGETYNLDPGEYGAADDPDFAAEQSGYESGASGLDLTEDEGVALFTELLDSWHISPYTPWETLIASDTGIVTDERYTVLPTTRARKAAWEAWSRARITALKAERLAERPINPRVAYLAFLAAHASVKLYWPEFRRKFKREAVMKDGTGSAAGRLSDKDREKLYRAVVARLKMPASALKADLEALLQTCPLSELHRDTALDDLPELVTADVRFVGLVPSVRDPIIRAWIEKLPPLPSEAGYGNGVEETAEEVRERKRKTREHEKRERALRERERAVDEERRRRDRDIRLGASRLREGERELEEAMKVGNRGLRAQLVGVGGEATEQPSAGEDEMAGA